MQCVNLRNGERIRRPTKTEKKKLEKIRTRRGRGESLLRDVVWEGMRSNYCSVGVKAEQPPGIFLRPFFFLRLGSRYLKNVLESRIKCCFFAIEILDLVAGEPRNR